MTVRPTNITVSRSRGLLQIDWEDGHYSEYPLAGLRSACPCAECRGGHENMGGPGSPEMLEIPLMDSQATSLADLQAVGNYAIQLFWRDGHSFGIYTWGYLRELCPCDDHASRSESLESSTQ